MKQLAFLGLGVLILVFESLAMPQEASGKGPVDLMLVSSTNRSESRVADELALAPFSPWDDAFLGAYLPGQPDEPSISHGNGYQIWLYIAAPDDLRALDWHGLRPDPAGSALR